MTIKEFSHKYALVFFWATVVLTVLLLINTCGRSRYMMMRGGYDYDRYDYDRFDKNMMNTRYNRQRQIINPNNTPGAAGTVETGAPVNPNVPLEVQ